MTRTGPRPPARPGATAWRSGGTGGVSAGSVQACEAGASVLARGGNAADAAIAVAATVAVTLPMSVGFGGDLVAVRSGVGGSDPCALLALGAAPGGASVAAFRERGLDAVPRTGILSATVPAFWDGLVELHRAARLPMADLLEPATTLASEGFVVTPQFSRWVANNAAVIEDDPPLRALYLPGGRPPAEGSVHRNPPLADLLRQLVSPGDQRAWLGAQVLAAARRHGGLLTGDDIQRRAAETVPSDSVRFGDAHVHVTPAPTQGPVLALALAMAAHLHGRQPARAWPHALAETVKLAFYERLLHLSDPRTGRPSLRFDAPTAAGLAAEVGEVASAVRYRGWYHPGDTTSFVTADGAGGVVSAVASLSLGFGAGVSALDGALIFNNRLGRSATLDPGHANACTPGARPVNTIHAWVAHDGETTAGGGTPGGDAQVQWNLQALSRRFLEGGTWEQAVHQPRFTVLPGADLIEAAADEVVQVDRGAVVAGHLRAHGHPVVERRDVGGCLRVLVAAGGGVSGADDGRQQGATVLTGVPPTDAGAAAAINGRTHRDAGS